MPFNMSHRENGYSCKDNEELVKPKEGTKCVGINGNWYDVTHFIDKHPGGPIISNFVGKDATTVFNSYRHPTAVLMHRKPVGTYKLPARHPADEEFELLRKKYEKLGYFETDWIYYAKKLLFALLLLGITCYLIINVHHLWYARVLGGVTLALFWQQIGFAIHDLMHSQVFRTNRGWDRAFGILIGTVGFGMSVHWWQEEHIFHHGMTNAVDVATQWIDPQMWESAWAQNEKMFPMFKGLLHYWLIHIQHLTFVPMITIFGRVVILVESYLVERRWYEWLAIIIHWTWMIALLSCLPTWNMVIQVYGLACCVEGIFHFQLIVSHYSKTFTEMDDFHKTSWYLYMVRCTLNIDNYWWSDWYYGGLNFHIEHHLYPMMARKYLRQISPDVRYICNKYGLKYESYSLVQGVFKTLVHLKRCGSHYKLDPR